MTIYTFRKYCEDCEKETEHVHDTNIAGGDLCAMKWCNVCFKEEYIH